MVGTGHKALPSWANAGDLELGAIYEISKILSSSLNLQQTIGGVMGVLSAQLQMRRVMISLVQESGELQVVGAIGLSRAEISRGRFRVGEGITGRIMKTGAPMVVPDVAEEPLFLNRTGARDLEHLRGIAFIGVPVKIGRESIGVLSVDREENTTPINFDRDVRFLSMVANLVGQTVNLHRHIASEREDMLREKQRLQKELHGKYSITNIIGTSKRMQEVFAEVYQAAPGRATVLLRGESGTGKEVIARAIHELSPRKDGPFIRVNCAALSENLLESELFGHEKGAFTGALQERKGRFEQAHGGTLFLDEIGEISPAFQTKLLRALQEREFERVGGNRSIRVDVRIIAATNRNLEEAVTKGGFRADLYYRLNVVSLFLPPLRERREDIPQLAVFFLERFNADNHRKLTLGASALQVMLDCNWPGNVRELENCVERTATMTRSDEILNLDMPCQKGKCLSLSLQSYGGSKLTPISIPVIAEVPPVPLAEEAPDSERERLYWAMEKSGWVQAKAARMLDLTPRQMGYALKKHNISIKRM